MCKQNSDEFFCDCGNTGYSGAVCQTRKDFNLQNYKIIFFLINIVIHN